MLVARLPGYGAVLHTSRDDAVAGPCLSRPAHCGRRSDVFKLRFAPRTMEPANGGYCRFPQVRCCKLTVGKPP